MRGGAVLALIGLGAASGAVAAARGVLSAPTSNAVRSGLVSFAPRGRARTLVCLEEAPLRLPTFGLTEREQIRFSHMILPHEPLPHEMLGLQVLLGAVGTQLAGLLGMIFGTCQIAPFLSWAPGRFGGAMRLSGWHTFTAVRTSYLSIATAMRVSGAQVRAIALCLRSVLAHRHAQGSLAPFTLPCDSLRLALPPHTHRCHRLPSSVALELVLPPRPAALAPRFSRMGLVALLSHLPAQALARRLVALCRRLDRYTHASKRLSAACRAAARAVSFVLVKLVSAVAMALTALAMAVGSTFKGMRGKRHTAVVDGAIP